MDTSSGPTRGGSGGELPMALLALIRTSPVFRRTSREEALPGGGAEEVGWNSCRSLWRILSGSPSAITARPEHSWESAPAAVPDPFYGHVTVPSQSGTGEGLEAGTGVEESEEPNKAKSDGTLDGRQVDEGVFVLQALQEHLQDIFKVSLTPPGVKNSGKDGVIPAPVVKES